MRLSAKRMIKADDPPDIISSGPIPCHIMPSPPNQARTAQGLTAEGLESFLRDLFARHEIKYWEDADEKGSRDFV
jgi:hypothetical protein